MDAQEALSTYKSNGNKEGGIVVFSTAYDWDYGL